MNARLKTTLVAAFVTAVVAVGCGDGGDSADDAGSAEADSSGKAVFVKQANAACSQAWEEVLGKATAYVDRHRSGGLPEEVLNARALKAAVLTMIDTEIDAIRALDPPEGDEQQQKAMLATLEAGYDKAKAQRAKLTLSELGDSLKADKRLQSYGLSQCRQ